jgi:hypothetical protein
VKCERLRKPDAFTVRVEVPGAAGFGENDPLEPLAKPDADSATDPAKPFSDPIVTVYVVVELRPIVAEDGETEIVKSPAGTDWTTSVAETECVVPPLVPVIVKGYVPGLIEVVSTDNVDEPEPVTDGGVNVPFARPVWDSPTELENPFSAPTLTVYVALVAGMTVFDDGETPTVKSAAGVPTVKAPRPFGVPSPVGPS